MSSACRSALGVELAAVALPVGSVMLPLPAPPPPVRRVHHRAITCSTIAAMNPRGRPGSRWIFRCDDDEELWHDRIPFHILVSPAMEVVALVALTPDLNMVVDELSVPPLRDFRSGDGTLLPAGLGAKHRRPVYRFTAGDVPSAATVAAHLAEADRCAVWHSRRHPGC